jgi:hypothetical protein
VSDIVAVLVVPAPNDPGGLLAKGACGGVPAMVGWYPPDANWSRIEWMLAEDHANRRALPLWWNGALCPEGWDRARRAYAVGVGAVLSHPAILYAESFDPTIGEVETMADGLCFQGLASRVVRLTRVGGRLVELEPAEVGT